MRNITALFCATAIVLTSTAALAGSSGTANTACGSTSNGWNVPNGAVAFSRGPGPVKATLDAVGEYRTHTMLSHGPNGWVTHAAMYTPGTTGWPTYCSTPLNPDELKNGFPAASQIYQGALYTYLYKNGAVEVLYYQRGNANSDTTDEGANIANYVWSSIPYQWVTSKQDGGQGFYRLKSENGSLMNYSLYQFRDSQSSNEGRVDGNWNYGIVCSSLIAYAQNKAGYGTVNEWTYNHTSISNGLSGLKNGVETDCNNGLGFWTGLGAAVTCFEGICDDAGRQVANCMAVGRCDTDTDGSNSYQSVINDWSATATAISPDHIGGWSGHPYTGEGVSVWAYDGNQTPQWNQAGNSYSCWF